MVGEGAEDVFTETSTISATIIHDQSLHLATVVRDTRIILDAQQNLDGRPDVFNEQSRSNLSQVSSFLGKLFVSKILNLARRSYLHIEEEELKEAAHLL